MDKEAVKVQGEKYAIKKDKVAEEVQTARYSLKKILELTREIFKADSCYLYLVNTEMDDDEKNEIIRKRVEHIKNVYEKRKEIYPNELEIVERNPNRAIILNFIDVSEKDDERNWKIDSNNKPEKYVVFDKCISAGPIGDGLKATVEADKVYFDAVDSVTSDESNSEINISIFEEGLNAYIARTKKIVIFSSDKAISRHNSSANYNVKKGIIHRCEMMIGFPLIDENKSVIGILKVEKYIINYDMGEYNYKFEKTKIDRGVEDVKKYLPLFVRLIKSSKEDLNINSYEELFRGMKLLEDLKRIKPIILKDVLIRLLKSLDEFFRTHSCEKLCTSMGLLGDLDKVNEELLKSIDVIEFNLSEKLQNTEWNSLEYLMSSEDSEDDNKNFEELLQGLKSLYIEKNAKLLQYLDNLQRCLNKESSESYIENNCYEKILAENLDLTKSINRIKKYKDTNKQISDLLIVIKKTAEVSYPEKHYISLRKLLRELEKEDRKDLINTINKFEPELLYDPKRIKCPKEIDKEIYRILEYLKRIDNYERIIKNTHSSLEIRNYGEINKSLEKLNNNELNYLKRIKTTLAETEIKISYSETIYEYIDILKQLEVLKEKINKVLERLEVLEKSSYEDKQVTSNLVEELHSLGETKNELKNTQKRTKHSIEIYESATTLLENLLENLNDAVAFLKGIRFKLAYVQKEAKNSPTVSNDINTLVEDLNKLESSESVGKRIIYSLTKLKKSIQLSYESLDKTASDKDFYKFDIDFCKKIDKLIKKIEYLAKLGDGLDKNKVNFLENHHEISNLIESLDKELSCFDKIKSSLLDTQKRAKSSSEVYEEIDVLLEDLTELEVIEKIEQNPLESQKEFASHKQSCNDLNFTKKSCKNVINLKETLNMKLVNLNNIISIFSNTQKTLHHSKIIKEKLDNLKALDDELVNIREYVQKLHNEKEVKRLKNDKERLPKNPVKVKWNDQFNEDISYLLENLKRIERHKVTHDIITKKLDNCEKTTYSCKYSEEIYNSFRDLINSEINQLLKYLREAKPSILENIKNIKDEVKVNKDICDVNSSTKIERSKCPEQINKEIYDITLDLFYELKRKEYIGYDEILNSISEYMNNISKLLNLNADMTRSFKEFLEGVRKHEELLLFGLNDYRDHFVHQFHVFISGYIIINELGIDIFMNQIKENKEYILGKEKFSYETSRSDVLRIWFLAASYHDYAYILEKIDKELTSFFKDVLGYSFTVKFNWEQLLTRSSKFPNYLNQFVNFFDSGVGTKQDILNRQNILRRNYLDSIIKSHDHGVLSALLLTEYTKDSKEKRFYEYMCAALAISLHNEPVFKDFTEKNKVLFESFPIAFLLAYCDTAQAFGRLEGKEHVESSKFPVKFSGIKIEKNKNHSNTRVRVIYKLEYLCEQLNKIPTEDKIIKWAKNVNNVFESINYNFEIEYYKKDGKELIHALSFKDNSGII